MGSSWEHALARLKYDLKSAKGNSYTDQEEIQSRLLCLCNEKHKQSNLITWSGIIKLWKYQSLKLKHGINSKKT